MYVRRASSRAPRSWSRRSASGAPSSPSTPRTRWFCTTRSTSTRSTRSSTFAPASTTASATASSRDSSASRPTSSLTGCGRRCSASTPSARTRSRSPRRSERSTTCGPTTRRPIASWPPRTTSGCTASADHFLTRVHDMLDTWPLTITASTHGPEGVARAVSEVGTTDIGTIVRDYHGKAFGFASRNFYAEFLAALDVERDFKTYFGDMSDEPPLRSRERRLERPLGIEAAARLARTGRSELASLNPALSTLVVSGRRPIPSGYRLRLPESAGSSFQNRLAEFSAEQRV